MSKEKREIESYYQSSKPRTQKGHKSTHRVEVHNYINNPTKLKFPLPQEELEKIAILSEN